MSKKENKKRINLNEKEIESTRSSLERVFYRTTEGHCAKEQIKKKMKEQSI